MMTPAHTESIGKRKPASKRAPASKKSTSYNNIDGLKDLGISSMYWLYAHILTLDSVLPPEKRLSLETFLNEVVRGSASSEDMTVLVDEDNNCCGIAIDRKDKGKEMFLMPDDDPLAMTEDETQGLVEALNGFAVEREIGLLILMTESGDILAVLITPEDIEKAGITVSSFLLHKDTNHRIISAANIPEMLGVQRVPVSTESIRLMLYKPQSAKINPATRKLLETLREFAMNKGISPRVLMDGSGEVVEVGLEPDEMERAGITVPFSLTEKGRFRFIDRAYFPEMLGVQQ